MHMHMDMDMYTSAYHRREETEDTAERQKLIHLHRMQVWQPCTCTCTLYMCAGLVSGAADAHSPAPHASTRIELCTERTCTYEDAYGCMRVGGCTRPV